MVSIREEIIRMVDHDAVIISHHARVRIFERNISTDDLLSVIRFGEIIELYVDDELCPAMLMLGFIKEDAYHVVIGLYVDHLRVITTYIPDKDYWNDVRTRRRED